MTRSEKILCAVYALVAMVALYATWSNNIAFSSQPHSGGPLGFIHALYVNHAAASIANDLFLVALVAAIFMLMEGRRLQMRFVWIYVVFSVLIAIAVVFPLFLIARQIKLSRAAHSSHASKLGRA